MTASTKKSDPATPLRLDSTSVTTAATFCGEIEPVAASICFWPMPRSEQEVSGRPW